MYEAVADADAEARREDVPGPILQPRVRAAATYATARRDRRRRASPTHWAGSAGLRPGIIQRCLRDLLAGSQHIYVDNNTLTGYAAALVADAAPNVTVSAPIPARVVARQGVHGRVRERRSARGVSPAGVEPGGESAERVEHDVGAGVPELVGPTGPDATPTARAPAARAAAMSGRVSPT